MTAHIARFSISVFICVLLVQPFAVANEQVVSINTRPDVTLSFLYLKNAAPKASLILFAGYGGYLNITADGIQQPSTNFLVRTREHFYRHGFNVAVVDTASDYQSDEGILGERHTQKHADDIGKVIDWLRNDSKVPVWLVGTSRGTISAANVAARKTGEIPADGLVLTASVTVSGNRNTGHLGDVDLAMITIPTLLAHHKDDDCYVTPYNKATLLLNQIINSPQIAFYGYTQGEKSFTNTCGPNSAHGFLGIEEQVVQDISHWISQARLAANKKHDDAEE